MKTKLLFILTLGFSLTGKSQDLVPGNLSFNYDFQTAVLSSITLDIENIASFATFGSVTVDVYIVDIGSNSCLVETVQTDVFGISGGDSETLQLSNIDLDALCNPPTGNYYFEVEVDVDNDESEDNENNNLKTYTSQGFYYEKLNTASIDEKEQIKINVYPNPVTDILNISSELSLQLSFKLMSSDGKIVKDGLFDSSNQIDVSDLKKGVYSLIVTSENKTVTEKIIIQ